MYAALTVARLLYHEPACCSSRTGDYFMLDLNGIELVLASVSPAAVVEKQSASGSASVRLPVRLLALDASWAYAQATSALQVSAADVSAAYADTRLHAVFSTMRSDSCAYYVQYRLCTAHIVCLSHVHLQSWQPAQS
jgi:hypothetical protein